MTTVTITLPAADEDSQVGEVSRASSGYWSQTDVQTRIGLSTEGGGGTIWLPYAPREVTYEGYGSEWSEVSRDGNRKPLLLPSKKKLRKMSFSVSLARPDWNDSVDVVIGKLQEWADTSDRILISYSAWENGFWRLLNMRVSSTMRSESDNSITRATVDLDFAECSDVSRNISPVTGGVSPQAGSSKTKTGKPKKGDQWIVPQWIITTAGDTLHSLAIKWYRDAKEWKNIAKKNNMTKADKPIPVGTRLRLF